MLSRDQAAPGSALTPTEGLDKGALSPMSNLDSKHGAR